MTPQEQPDSQAGDTLNIQLKLIMPVVPDFDKRIQELRTVIDRYAERLATERAVAAIDRIEASIKQHTVPESTGFAAKSYIFNTLEFERQRLTGEADNG